MLVCREILLNSKSTQIRISPLTDLRSIFHFHAVYSKNGKKIIGLHPYLGGWHLSWEIVDPPLSVNKTDQLPSDA